MACVMPRPSARTPVARSTPAERAAARLATAVQGLLDAAEAIMAADAMAADVAPCTLSFTRHGKERSLRFSGPLTVSDMEAHVAPIFQYVEDTPACRRALAQEAVHGYKLTLRPGGGVLDRYINSNTRTEPYRPLGAQMWGPCTDPTWNIMLGDMGDPIRHALAPLVHDMAPGASQVLIMGADSSAHAQAAVWRKVPDLMPYLDALAAFSQPLTVWRFDSVAILGSFYRDLAWMAI